MFEREYKSNQEEVSENSPPNIRQFELPQIQECVKVNMGTCTTNGQQQTQSSYGDLFSRDSIADRQQMQSIKILTKKYFETHGLTSRLAQISNASRKPISPIHRSLKEYSLDEIPEKVSLSMNGDKTSESEEENGSDQYLAEILASLNSEKDREKTPAQSQDQSLTQEHFVMFQKEFGSLEGILIGFQNYITKSYGRIGKPTPNDVILYLRKTVPLHKEVNVDMIDKCIEKLKLFFAWTSIRNIYPDVASGITVQDIIASRISVPVKKTPLINRENGQLVNQVVQNHTLNAKVSGTNGAVIVQKEKTSAKNLRLKEDDDQIAQGYTFNTQWLKTYIADESYHKLHILQNVDIYPLNLLMDYFDKNKISNPKPSDIVKFFVFHRKDANRKYINKYLTAFKRFFTWTEDKTKDDHDIYYPNIRKYCRSQEEIRKLVDETILDEVMTINKKLETALFEPHYIDDFIAKTRDLPPPDKLNPKLIKTLERFRDYIKGLSITKPGQQDILKFFAECTEYSSPRGINTMLFTFGKLFEWTSLNKDKNGQCLYPDIWFILPTATQVAEFIGQEDQESES